MRFMILMIILFNAQIFSAELISETKTSYWSLVIAGSEGVKYILITQDEKSVIPLCYFQINVDGSKILASSDKLKSVICTISNIDGTFDITISGASYGSSIVINNGNKCLKLEQIPYGRNISESSVAVVGKMNDNRSNEIYKLFEDYFIENRKNIMNYKLISKNLIEYYNFKEDIKDESIDKVDPYKWQPITKGKSNSSSESNRDILP